MVIFTYVMFKHYFLIWFYSVENKATSAITLLCFDDLCHLVIIFRSFFAIWC